MIQHDTALERAAAGGDVELVQLLLKYGTNRHYWNNIIAALRSPDPERRLQLMMPCDNTDGFGWRYRTALHMAADVGEYLDDSTEAERVQIATILLDNGANPNIQHNCQRDSQCCSSPTPLHLAAEAGFVDIRRLIIDYGTGHIGGQCGEKPPQMRQNFPICRLMNDSGCAGRSSQVRS
ncbi:hypothetical protein N657DRAFT_157557 [Parathielavia appendiculata]|uniref:Ankyrin repeat protein n=1 Tax=Parathielavia appendiculata TaxID=2587402 RepID=A0AAN6TTV2_9PEZI|nr:hypothetical protein N657DRAFT_157557 [Parathielavia appendiculata]